MNPFEGANLTGIRDRLAMEDEGKRSIKDDAVVLITGYSLWLLSDAWWWHSLRQERVEDKIWQRRSGVGFKHTAVLRYKQKISIRQLGPWLWRAEETSVIV